MARPISFVIKGTGGGDIFVGVDDSGTNAYAGGTSINDGTAELSKDMAFRVVMTDGPVVDLNGNQKGQDWTAAFTEQTPVSIARSNATITDPDSANLAVADGDADGAARWRRGGVALAQRGGDGGERRGV